MGTATTTTPSDIEPITSDPANDNDPVDESASAAEPEPDDVAEEADPVEEPAVTLEPQPANDNSPVEDLPAASAE